MAAADLVLLQPGSGLPLLICSIILVILSNEHSPSLGTGGSSIVVPSVFLYELVAKLYVPLLFKICTDRYKD